MTEVNFNPPAKCKHRKDGFVSMLFGFCKHEAVKTHVKPTDPNMCLACKFYEKG